MKPNKACDANVVVSPVVYKYLPITFLLNVQADLIFIPVTWIHFKLIVLLKNYLDRCVEITEESARFYN